MSRSCNVVALVAVGFLLALGMPQAQQATQSAPTYTAAQAAAGKAAYDASCASCHGGNLDDGALAPPLKGVAFVQKYGGKSVEKLFTKVGHHAAGGARTRSAPRPRRAIVAYLLQANAIVAGTTRAAHRPGGAGAHDDSRSAASASRRSRPTRRRCPAVKRPNPLDAFTPVSDAQLVEPPAQDWLTWRRSYDAQGFSPLTQITPRNVAGLRVAWSWSLPPGSSETTPLVHDGVMFVQGASDRVQALDARTGDLLWQYTRRLPQGVGGSFKRGIALHGDRLYIGTSDVHVIALDAKTGTLVWDQQIGDPKVRERIGGGPLVAKGKVMIGTIGTGVGAKPGGPEIVGLDADTGRVAWRVHTIAQPGTPGGDSWNGMPLQQRSGASVWTPGSYDPGTGLAYFGTGNTYDTGPLVKPTAQPRRHQRRALHRLDAGDRSRHRQGEVALPAPSQRSVGSRLGVRAAAGAAARQRREPHRGVHGRQDRHLRRARREVRAVLFSIDLGLNNLVTSIDPKTGAKTIEPELVPGDGQVKMVCPHAAGAKNWLPASYIPATKTLFVPIVEACMDLFPVPGGGRGGLSTGVNLGVRPRPDSDGNYGRAAGDQPRDAQDDVDHAAARADHHRHAGHRRRRGVRRRARSLAARLRRGQRQGAVGDAAQRRVERLPISYAVNGKQYIAIVAGRGGFHYASYAPLVPELTPPPDRGSSLWVFELP